MTPWKPPALLVTASAVPVSGCLGPTGLQVNFSGSAQGGLPPYTYNWNFSDGSTGTGQTISHSYTARRAFFPSLTVIDSTTRANGTDLVPVTVFSGGVQLLVTDKDSKPLAQANITSLVLPPGQSSFTLTTNTQGQGSVTCLIPGAYRVQISHAGFISQNTTFSVANETVNVSVALVQPPPPQDGFLLYWVAYGLIGVGVAVGLGLFFRRRSRRSTRGR